MRMTIIEYRCPKLSEKPFFFLTANPDGRLVAQPNFEGEHIEDSVALARGMEVVAKDMRDIVKMVGVTGRMSVSTFAKFAPKCTNDIRRTVRAA
jgi:hypothetical protein